MKTVVNGPVLSLQTFNNSQRCTEIINNREFRGAPAIYVFTATGSDLKRELQNMTRSGALVVNDLWMPFINVQAPVECAGASWWGSHGGKRCFDEFSMNRAICEKANTRFLDQEMRYPNPSTSAEQKMKDTRKLGSLPYFEPYSVWLKIRLYVYLFLAFALWKLGFWTLTFPLFQAS
jgi:hypothetical protein